MTSLKALCAGVMTLCVASLSFTSCYDDSALNEKIDGLEEEVSDLDTRLQAIENLKAQLEALTAKVDALYTIKFQVSDADELQYSFDGGKTWVGTGVILVDECDCVPTPPCDHVCPPCEHECPPCQYVPCEHECPEVSVVDNGTSVTITIGDASFTIEKPAEIVFEIRAGKLYFESEGTLKVAIKSAGIEDVTVMSYPKGWYAEIASDGMLEVTAPDFQSTVEEGYWNDDWTEYITIPATAAGEGYVKVHACSVEGECMVGKLPVVVSAQPVSVKAYGGMAYFNAVGNFPPEFYYGASPRDAFETEVAGLLEDLNAEGWSDYTMNNGEFSVEAEIADLLGAEPEMGVEYVVWAIVSDWSKQSYSIEDFIISYYSPVQVTAVEDESKRTAYNVTATVTVEGAESYYALAIPANYLDYDGALEEYKANFIASFSPDSWSGPMGKFYTESYTGSVLDIAEGTTSSMSGNYAPNLDIYLLVLPQDGRSWDEYTVEDVFEFKFTTASLVAGGSVDATAEQVFKYMAEEFDNMSYEFVTVEKVVDKYSQLAVEVKPSADNWVAFYFMWLEDDEWALYSGDDELLVDRILDEWGMTPNDVEFPYYEVIDVDPATTHHFVAMFVDDAGKYGKLAKVSMTTDDLVYSDVMFTEPYETNLADGVLKNTTDFKFKPTVEGGTAASYKYYWLQTDYYNPYEGMDDAELAQTIHFDRDKRGVVVTAAELVDGYIVVPNNEFGSSYMVAVLPYDENGAPGKSAAIFEYESTFAIDNVITEGAEFEATKPAYTIGLPSVMDEFGDGAIYYYTYIDYYSKYQFSYELNVAITPVEGTTVMATYVNGNNTTLTGNAATDASALWQGSLESWYNYTNITEPFESSNRFFNHYEDVPAPDVWFIISWTDADGNYYYEAKSLQSELQKLADEMYALIHGGAEEVTTPDGKQLTFVWADMMDAPSCLDFGVSTPGYLAVAYDMAAMYGEDGLPEEMIGMYMQYQAWEYTVTATDATSGVITIQSYDMYGDLQTAEGSYTEWDGTTCKVTFEMLMLEDVTMTVAAETIPLYIEQGGIMM